MKYSLVCRYDIGVMVSVYKLSRIGVAVFLAFSKPFMRAYPKKALGI
jgi:hypothetical protein